MARRRRKPLPSEPVNAQISDLSHDGRGVTRINDKVTFVHGALPGEEVEFKYSLMRRDFDEGVAIRILNPSKDRVEPRCPHTDACGGCVLQHMDPDAQIQSKHHVLMENLERIGRVRPDVELPTLTADRWGYRRRARLSVRRVAKKERTLVGFRERAGRFVADLQECHVLVPAFGFRILDLAAMLDTLDGRDQIPQLEIASADNVEVMIVRHLQPLSTGDEQKLADFEKTSGIRVLVQPKGPKTIAPLRGDMPQLFFSLPDYDLEFRFTPANFVQVNASINRKMIALAIDKLQLEQDSRVLDLFCGLGNFTLPIARSGANVTGIEGDEELVSLARENAERNGLRADFEVADLTEERPFGTFDRVLLDPPRSGAEGALRQVAQTGAKRVVYVSCHPGSLARDAGILVRDHGFRLLEAGVMDMFPHTAHVESIAVFERS